jgi:hypothetical protein
MSVNAHIAFPLQPVLQFVQALAITRKLEGALNNAYSLRHHGGYRSVAAKQQAVKALLVKQKRPDPALKVGPPFGIRRARRLMPES